MTELKDTIDLMLSEDPIERLNAEYQQLTIRTDKLFGFIQMIKKGKVAKPANFPLLKKQLAIMSSYKKILEDRISLL